MRNVYADQRRFTPHGHANARHSQIGLMMNTYTHVLPEIERTAITEAARTSFGDDDVNQ
jgi:hypothetical protein